jgi:hypothetical protein
VLVGADKEELHAHKGILAAHSRVFDFIFIKKKKKFKI